LALTRDAVLKAATLALRTNHAVFGFGFERYVLGLGFRPQVLGLEGSGLDFISLVALIGS
jgi:hypothetical protein